MFSVGFVLLAREVYQVYVSEEFWESTMLIPVFVSSYYAIFLCTFPVNFEYYHKKTKVVAAITVGCCFLNIGLNYLLIRHIGMAGAAVATLISHSLQLALHYLYVRFVLGGGDYPFCIGLWAKYTGVYAAFAAVSALTARLPILRWGVGAAIGLFKSVVSFVLIVTSYTVADLTNRIRSFMVRMKAGHPARLFSCLRLQ